MELALPSEVTAISPSVDKLMLLIRKCRCAPGNETDIEIALREALENAVIHGNHENPRKHVYVSCRCEAGEEVRLSSGTKDKDLTAVRYRTLPPQGLLNPVTAVEST
jgi:anti-sigma regulatory factor (Ser/Thr protein kinase)